MKYSVIIPAFQCESTLRNTVCEVVDSGLCDFEIIIIDDGSTDGTAEICDSLEKEFPFVTCIHKENGGVSSARNLGIDVSKGEYILFADADDGYKKGSLSAVCEHLEKHRPDMLIFGVCFEYYKNGVNYRTDKMIYPHEGLLSPAEWSADFSSLFEHNALSSVCNKTFKAQILKNENIRFKDGVFIMEDFLFVLDYLKYTENIYFLHDDIYRYRQPDDEMRSFTRVAKISDLNAYLTPFYESSKDLKNALSSNYGLSFPEGEDVLFSLYRILLNQKAYYSNLENLKKLAETVKHGRWENRVTDDILFNDLKNGDFKKILLRNKKTQLRHKTAVAVKKTGIYRKLRGGQ